jgi:cytochrome c biogenesis protein CcmG/thiol:disulfide interchange protein DsbE
MLAGAGLIVLAVALAVFARQPRKTNASIKDGTPSAIPSQVNYPSPEFSLTGVEGDSVSLADYRGQVILVNNWATWCPPCRAEMPELEAYYQAHKWDGFMLIGVSAGDTQSQVEDFVLEYRVTFPMWLDPTGKSLQAFQTDYLPSSFVIDTTGIVRLAWTGAISLEMLEEYVTPLLRD